MNEFYKSAVALTLITVLSACGGGNDDSQDGKTDSANGNNGYVTGTFLSATNTGDFFIRQDKEYDLLDSYGKLARACIGEGERYYETNRIQVYGSSQLPDSDFLKAATWVDSGLDEVLGKMGYDNFNSFIEKRRHIADFAITYTAFAIVNFDIVEMPTEIADGDYEPKMRWAHAYLADLPLDEAKALVLESYRVRTSFTHKESDLIYPKKVRVCLHSSDSNYRYGEGDFMGINIAAPSVNTPNKHMEIIKHELVHMVQSGAAYNINISPFPRWFSEGQAVYISGQKIADKSDHHKYDTPSFVYHSDEQGYDQADIYGHYGLAYKYIQDANGIDSVMDMIRNLRYQEGMYYFAKMPEDYDHIGGEGVAFVYGWDKANFKSMSGTPLSLMNYKREYHQLLSN